MACGTSYILCFMKTYNIGYRYDKDDEEFNGLILPHLQYLLPQSKSSQNNLGIHGSVAIAFVGPASLSPR